jgi:hypothetical protein
MQRHQTHSPADKEPSRPNPNKHPAASQTPSAKDQDPKYSDKPARKSTSAITATMIDFEITAWTFDDSAQRQW